jgi:glutathione synthase/RimK-type ligase-like ATP-grasp enzyme
MIIVPYNWHSKSVWKLAEELNFWLVSRKEIVTEKGINWGCSKLWTENPGLVLNKDYAVEHAVYKKKLYSILEQNGIPAVENTDDKEVAKRWLDEGNIVFARKDGLSRGKGIKILHQGYEVPEADFYTKYIKKRKEFRIHCTKFDVFDITQKKRKRDEEQNEFVRNRKNGWIFARQDLKIPNNIEDLAIKTIKVLELDFGAVDIIYDLEEKKLKVLEVNTAPGLEGTTLLKYVEMFKNHPHFAE